MNMLNYAHTLYSLDTLDTRFTASSTTPLGSTVSQVDPAKPSPRQGISSNINGTGVGKDKQLSDSPPSRWNTFEYYLYYLVICAALPLMFKAAYDISKRTSIFGI